MARITVEDCLSQIGNENRFSLIHLAVERVKQHRKNAPFLVKCKNKEIVATLREIASGEVSFATIKNFTPSKEEVAAQEDTSVLTVQKGDGSTEQASL
ncbi:DNA-directed RNA polymerase subunit omega [Thiovibrio frasassiensis]|jgi:DNA-directed RNA polymerase subunit omega|uniref:DNA-directed RNA polymerase subunit omega n=1 Tax=Thiovibrio frasassiensis TaxID=2984131 RepID=A0A9X4MLA7_9BACT|nr:DNA-directed RNA polymerase subunit omega [Thiovibrio frasassiensis]MDG4474842.1 DNA-directed RNA polymerase subunit omega [Thiovibrio frasassiensis]